MSHAHAVKQWKKFWQDEWLGFKVWFFPWVLTWLITFTILPIGFILFPPPISCNSGMSFQCFLGYAWWYGQIEFVTGLITTVMTWGIYGFIIRKWLMKK